MYKEYLIWYGNPNIRFWNDNMKILKDRNGNMVIIKARNDNEAKRKAGKRLQTTGMSYTVEQC